MSDKQLHKESNAVSPVNSLDVSGSGEVIESVRLKESFNLWSTLGIAFSFIATPLSIGSYLVLSLAAGGSAYFFWGYVVSFLMNGLIAVSLAEISSFLPHTSGQIFWTSQLSPKGWERGLSYTCGAFTILAWLFWTAGTFLSAAELIFAFVEVCGSSFTALLYQDFLLYVAYAVFALFMNTFGFKLMPIFSKLMIGYINIGSIFILITLLVRANPKPSAREVFLDVVDATGWNSEGLVFFLALLPGITAINGFDCAAHMADELPNPSVQVPQVMIGTVLLCGFAGLPMVIALLFSIVNADNLLEPVGGQAIFQLFVDSMDSLPLTIISCIIYLGLFTFACISITTTLSRCWWAFSKSGALPAHQWQSRVDTRFLLPVNSLIVVTFIEIIIGLLILGPSTVLSGVIGSATICFFVSYSIPIICFLFRGRNAVPAQRYLNLGRFGPWINVLNLLWALVVTVFLCFPSYIPVTAADMNYASVVVAVGVLFWGLNWVFFARNTYQIPTPLE